MKKLVFINICILMLVFLLTQAATAQNDASKTSSKVIYPTSFSISRPLRDILAEKPFVEYKGELREANDKEKRQHQTFMYTSADGPEYGNDTSVMQRKMGTRVLSNKAVIQSWAGQTGAYRPNDPTGAVGPNHYVQIVNATPVRVFNKIGTTLTTFTLGDLWSPAKANDGDPIVLYDKYADRWFLSQFDNTTGNNEIYIAISTTGDPSGSYYCYTFTSPDFPDYLKFSIWENGYYMTSNQTSDIVFCFERSQMLIGNPSARAVSAGFTQISNVNFFVPLPSDASDGGLPPAGSPLPIVAYYDNAWGTAGTQDGIDIWNMTVTWGTTPTASISGPTLVPTSAFDASYASTWLDVSQPGTTQKLDGIGGVPTFRAQWMPWSGYNSLVINFGVKISSSQRSIRWCELRQNQSTSVWSLYQEGTYTPDAATRWMGSIAMDVNGSIALCYAKSDATSIYPGLYYTGRLATDPLGTMTFAETTAKAGTSSSTTYRYGDYAQTALDPDGVTFWHTGEYTSSGVKTWIYSFKLPTGPLAPVANFMVDNMAPVCTGTVQFTDLTANSPTSWSWDFGDGQTSTLQNPSHTYATSGTYTVVLVATNAQGNNTETKTSFITVSLSNSPVATGNFRCGTGTVTLSATGANTLYWWDAATGGNYLGTGTSMTTPSIATTTTYYVENSIPESSVNVGLTVGGANSNTASYMIFDALETMTLVSVQARAGTAGTKTITLQNSAGTTIYTTTATVNAATTTITLNWVIPTGTGYRLVTNANSALWRRTTGVTYPYTAAGICSITGCSSGTGTFASWFNWTVKGAGCLSSRVPCVATINSTVTPSVSISASSSTICSGTSVTFTATPTNGGTPSYQWKIGSTNVGTNSNTFTSATLAQGDVVTCVITSTANCASPTTATSNAVTMTVNSSVTPSVAVTPSASTICAGTSVTFTAAPTNGGTPTYAWKLNGSAVGTNSSTYTNAALAQGDVVNCVMTSTVSCATPTSATSNSVTMTVNSAVTPSVTVTPSASTICSGTSVTFTAAPTNGGTPSYQWKLNGGNVGTNSNTYTNAALASGNTVSCTMTSTASCATPTTATSNTVTMTVNPSVTPSVAVTPSASTICAGTTVNFTAAPTNGGTPSYQWKLNGTNVGTNSTTYSNSALAQGDVVTCAMTSTASCASPALVTSTPITMTVNAAVTPSVVVTPSASTICSGNSVTFTAAPTNGGTPTYTWKLNGTTVGTNSSTYTNSALAQGDVVLCVMTSNASCASPTTATSNSVTMTVNSALTPSVVVNASSTTICSGTLVTFTAVPTNGGTPTYSWFLNGSSVGSNSSTYTNSGLSNGDIVRCQIASSLSCASPTSATSNNVSITVNSSLTPAVTITPTASNICAGTSVTFNASPTNGGTPTYNWLVNGTSVGSSPSYSSTTLNQGDVVTCVMGSSLSCASPTSATSNAVNMTVNSNVVPAVSVGASSIAICNGASVTFTATPSNGGTPSYQWMVNGSNAGTNSNVFTTNGIANNDNVSCIMTSTASCASPTTATSNTVNMTVNTSVSPSVIIGASQTNICAGTSVTFNATAVNGGTPTYTWLLNGSPVGTNSALYTNAGLTNGSVVTCQMTSSANCASPTTATSNGITMVVKPILSPSVLISSSPAGPVCPGTTKLFTPVPTNGGSSPSYDWTVDGSVVSSGSTFSGVFGNGQVISCTMTSNADCVNPLTATAMPITISVYTVSPVTVTEAGGVLTSSVANGNQWWEQTDGMIAGAVNQTFTPSVNGNYYTVVTDGNGCSATSNVFSMMTVSVNSSDAHSTITFSPNPTNGLMTITFGQAVNNGQLIVENALGQKVYEEAINQAMNSSKTIDFSSYAVGVYFVVIRDTKLNLKQKVLFDK